MASEGDELLISVRGAQCAVVWKDWKESWDAQEISQKTQLVAERSGGARVLTTEIQTGADDNLMVIHPESVDISDLTEDGEFADYLLTNADEYAEFGVDPTKFER